MPRVVCLDCGEKWLSCCPKCGSKEVVFETVKQTCLFYDWIERDKRMNILKIKSKEWDVLWAEYVRIMGWI